MKIKLNSEEREIPEGITIEELKELLGTKEGVAAFAVNGKMVRRGEHATHVISEGDEVLMISAAYGG